MVKTARQTALDFLQKNSGRVSFPDLELHLANSGVLGLGEEAVDVVIALKKDGLVQIEIGTEYRTIALVSKDQRFWEEINCITHFIDEAGFIETVDRNIVVRICGFEAARMRLKKDGFCLDSFENLVKYISSGLKAPPGSYRLGCDPRAGVFYRYYL